MARLFTVCVKNANRILIRLFRRYVYNIKTLSKQYVYLFMLEGILLHKKEKKKEKRKKKKCFKNFPQVVFSKNSNALFKYFCWKSELYIFFCL